MTDDAAQPTVDELDNDSSVAYLAPARLSNRVWVTSGSGLIRMAFCEQEGPGKPQRLCAAVVMSNEDAQAFLALLAEATLS